jgi:DNA replication and repair protein RecF
MRVTALTLTDFRNHAATRIASDAAMVALVGDNGAGKTNILEALSLLSPGRGLRSVALGEMPRTGGPGGFTIRARCADHGMAAIPDGDPLSIATGVSAAAPGRRQLRINGAEQAVAMLGEWLALLWLTPAMDRLFTDAAGGRRRFLDRLTLALFPGHARHATRYDAAMRARGRLLAAENAPDAQWLSALEAQMAEHGADIAAARDAAISALTAHLVAMPTDGFARPLLTLEQDGAPATVPSAADLADALRRSRARDAAAGRALTGPHRHDLAVVHAATGEAAARCSTGEQKALLLSIILAHGDVVAARRGARPILLLDEVAAHLDPGRRAALFARLHAAGGQVWMTGTEAALFAALPTGSLTLRVDAGVVD